MFDIGWSELVVIGVVALIAIGPKELPGVLRTVGQYMGKVRRMASEFQSQFQEAMREAEMADIKKSVDEITGAATKQFSDFDPIGTVRKEIESLSSDPFKDGAPTPSSASPEAASESLPAPVAAEATIPQASHAEAAVAPEAPQPAAAAPDAPHEPKPQDAKPQDAKPAGSGA
jgi:sec-independent protein translocase protein TatB